MMLKRAAATSSGETYSALLISSVLAAHAKTSRPRASDLASMVLRAAFSTSAPGLLASLVPSGSSSKTLLAALLDGSTLSGKNWNSSAMRRYRTRLAHLIAGLRTRELEYSLLPTLTASGYGSNRGGAAGRTGATRYSLESLAKLCPPLALPTLTANRSTYQRRRGVTYPILQGIAQSLSVTADMPETIMATDGASRSNGAANAPAHDSAPVLLPTLTASSATRGAAVRGKKAQGGPSLQELLLPTLCSRDEKGPGPAHTKSGVDLPQTVGGHLSPEFCEWYMGFPAGHTLPIQRWLEEQDALKRARRESGLRHSETPARRNKRKSSVTSSASSSKPSA